MQFFILINHLISLNVTLSSENSFIKTFETIPLSLNCGLLEWVEGADTFLNLIFEYRKSHLIEPTLEILLVEDLSYQNGIDKLLNIQRYEFLNYVINNTKSDDLRQIFWLRSPSSDIWYERINRFQRSCALMSIVGYILGLGDRHPSNIMIDRNTGDLIHIDFGECFFISKNRILFPEFVPFRLTRMFKNTFGIGGIDTIFMNISSNLFNLIIENNSSIKAVLEYFIKDSFNNFKN